MSVYPPDRDMDLVGAVHYFQTRRKGCKAYSIYDAGRRAVGGYRVIGLSGRISRVVSPGRRDGGDRNTVMMVSDPIGVNRIEETRESSYIINEVNTNGSRFFEGSCD